MAGGHIPARREDLIDQRPSRMNTVSHGNLMPATRRMADKTWPQHVQRLYDSFAESGQVAWFQQSDWEFAWFVCNEIAKYCEQDERAAVAMARAEQWDEEAGPLTPKERAAQGFPVSRPFVPRGGSAMKLQSYMSQLNRLMVTEADRRTAKVQLESAVEAAQDAAVVQISRYQAALGLKKAL